MLNDNIASENQAPRLFWLYQYLPRKAERAKSIRDIMSVYGSNPAEYANERKNLENDLKALASILEYKGLQRIPDWQENINGKTARYYIDANFALENINSEMIFFWEMLTSFTQHYLPVTIQNQLEEKLGQQHQAFMKQYQVSDLGKWKTHLITLPSVVAPPSMNAAIMETIHEALLKRRILEIDYRNKWQDETTTRQIYPVGLVLVDNMVYLTGFNPVEESIHDETMLEEHRNFAVNRIQTARLRKEALPDWLERPEFSLENLKRLGKLERYGDRIVNDLALLAHPVAVEHLQERPLSDHQTITEPMEDGWCIVTAQKVPYTERLHHWLFSMSSVIKIIGPRDLGLEIRQRLKDSLALYQRNDGLLTD